MKDSAMPPPGTHAACQERSVRLGANRILTVFRSKFSIGSTTWLGEQSDVRQASAFLSSDRLPVRASRAIQYC